MVAPLAPIRIQKHCFSPLRDIVAVRHGAGVSEGIVLRDTCGDGVRIGELSFKANDPRTQPGLRRYSNDCTSPRQDPPGSLKEPVGWQARRWSQQAPHR